MHYEPIHLGNGWQQNEGNQPSNQEDQDQEQNSGFQVPEAQEQPESGGFLVTPIDLEENPFEFEQGFDYAMMDLDEFIEMFKVLRDTNADVRIPDPIEGFGYSFIEKFGEIEPILNNNRDRGRNNNRGGGRGRNNFRGRGARGANNSRGGNSYRGGGRGGRGGAGTGGGFGTGTGGFNLRSNGNPFNRNGF